MSDQDIGRKMVETHELDYFLRAYEYVTGTKLILIKFGERPDFICETSKGSSVGVELTKITSDYGDIFKNLSDLDATGRAYELIEKKAEKINQSSWLTKDTILVLQLMTSSLREIKWIFTDELRKDFVSYGFAEIWIADYTELDAYGDVELFGLFPSKWWGYYQRKNPYRKPYG